MAGRYVKLLSATVHNFGSYSRLKFNFDELGLALISGPTGAGKSTVLDIVPWILYGVTSKNGSVYDVQSWQSEGEPTSGILEVSLSNSILTVTRIRGSGGKNDLYWTESGSTESYRGKDLVDTQRLLEARLGVDSDTFLSSTYFHEFSQSGTFFTANAKARRELLEQVCDLSFPLRLLSQASERRRETKTSADILRSELSSISGRFEQLRSSEVSSRESLETWDSAQKGKIKVLRAKAKTFEKDKEKKKEELESALNDWMQLNVLARDGVMSDIRDLENTTIDPDKLDAEEAKIRKTLRCKECGSLTDKSNEELRALMERKFNNNNDLKQLASKRAQLLKLFQETCPHDRLLAELALHKNTYIEQVAEESNTPNPFTTQLSGIVEEIALWRGKHKALSDSLCEKERYLSALLHIADLSGTLRGELIKKTVGEIEAQTNAYLDKHFDAEIRVSFSAGDADNIDVAIQKSGYQCNYRQLSRGQRSLLRLCFGISIMKAAANAVWTHFNVISFDEVLDGLSPDLKVKAVGILAELALDHSTVLVIDHCSEVKSQFNKHFTVEIINDNSVLSE